MNTEMRKVNDKIHRIEQLMTGFIAQISVNQVQHPTENQQVRNKSKSGRSSSLWFCSHSCSQFRSPFSLPTFAPYFCSPFLLPIFAPYFRSLLLLPIFAPYFCSPFSLPVLPHLYSSQLFSPILLTIFAP